MTERAVYVVAGLIVLALVAWLVWKWWSQRDLRETPIGGSPPADMSTGAPTGPTMQVALRTAAPLAAAESVEIAT